MERAERLREWEERREERWEDIWEERWKERKKEAFEALKQSFINIKRTGWDEATYDMIHKYKDIGLNKRK